MAKIGDLGDSCLQTGTVGINVSYGLTNLEGGNGREIGSFVLLSCLSRKTDSRWEEHSSVYVHLFRDPYTRG